MKFFIGMFVDNFKLWGSTRNFYLRISGVAMWVSLILIQVNVFQSKYCIIFFLVVFNLFSALSAVVTDAIMVIYARRDPEYGSSDLQTLHIIAFSVGGIAGSIISSYANEHFHPYYIFTFYWLISLLYTIFAYMIDDINVDENVNVWDNIVVTFNHLRNKVVFGTIVFLIISRGIIPNYSEIMYYYLINVLSFSKQTIAILDLIAFWTAIFGSFVYGCMLSKIEFKKTMIIAHIIIGMSLIPTYLLVTRISKNTFGIDDVVFSIFTDAALEVLFVAFVDMPTLVVQTKITPKNVEATIYNMFRTICNLTADFISPMIGGVIASVFSVTSKNFDNISWIVVVQFVLSLVPILFVWVLPSNQEIDSFYNSMQGEEGERVDFIPKASLEASEHVKQSDAITESKDSKAEFKQSFKTHV